MSCGWFILGKCEIQLQVVHVNILLVAAIPNVLLVLCFRWGCSLVGQTIRPACCWCRFDSPGAARDFSPGVNFQCRLSYGVRTPLCAITCVYICVHIKDRLFFSSTAMSVEQNFGLKPCVMILSARLWLMLAKVGPLINDSKTSTVQFKCMCAVNQPLLTIKKPWQQNYEHWLSQTHAFLTWT